MGSVRFTISCLPPDSIRLPCILIEDQKAVSKDNLSRFPYTILSRHRYLRSICREAHDTKLLNPRFRITAFQILEHLRQPHCRVECQRHCEVFFLHR